MQISPGVALLRAMSGANAPPPLPARPAPQVQPPQVQPRQTPTSTASAQRADVPRNAPPPVDPTYSVERIALADAQRDIPRGSLLDISV